jgi:hypothetical protein
MYRSAIKSDQSSAFSTLQSKKPEEKFIFLPAFTFNNLKIAVNGADYCGCDG